MQKRLHEAVAACHMAMRPEGVEGSSEARVTGENKKVPVEAHGTVNQLAAQVR